MSESVATPSPDVCMCLAFDADSDEQGWRPCPTNLCEREDHDHHPNRLVVELVRPMRELLWRLRESPKDYRYGGLRAALLWIFKGVAADEGE